MIEFKFKQFPTHLPISKNKTKKDRYMKVNSQSVYNSNVNRFSRNNVMDAMHNYALGKISKKIKVEDYPISIHYIYKTVINHGDISRRNDNIVWKYPSEDYIPSWDLENAIGLWIKGLNDALVIAGIIKDDSVQYVRKISYEFVPVDDINQREIIIQINTI